MHNKFPFHPLICYCFGSGDDTVEAQKLANETNERIADKTNDLTRSMFEVQNQWNLDRRDEEWAYNDPSAQMERYIKAGINPMYALGNVSAGEAQPLTSAQPGAMQMAHVEPEFDPYATQRVGNIIGASQSVLNGAEGFYKLALESQDVDTRMRAQRSEEAKNAADAAFKRSQTTGQDIFNNLNTRTFEAQVSTKLAQLEEIRSSIAKTNSETELYKVKVDNERETTNQIRAMVKFVGAQTDAISEQLKQGWRRLSIEQQNANTAEFSARSASYYEGENLKQRGREFQFSKEKELADLAHQSNQQVLDYVNNRVGWIQRIVGSNPFGQEFNTVIGGFKIPPDEMIDRISAAGTVLQKRVEQSPTAENIKSYQEYLNMVDNIPSAPKVPNGSQEFDIVNPSFKW